MNLGYGTPEADLPEAVYVSQTPGPRLEYFQVGNEVDLFKGHLRDPATWNAERYLEQWLVIARAVQQRLPQARFGMPDVASNVGWLRELSECWAAIQDKPNVVCLSHHYYWSGPPSNPMANIANLLQPDKRVASNAQVAQSAARRFGPTVQWRMTEGNTVYRGGKNGVSDVFAASLWSADYLLHLMNLGYAVAHGCFSTDEGRLRSRELPLTSNFGMPYLVFRHTGTGERCSRESARQLCSSPVCRKQLEKPLPDIA